MFDPLQIPHVFRARSCRPSPHRAIPSGFEPLDEALIGGWPSPSLIEILIDDYGVGELHVLLPLVRELVSMSNSPLLVWLNPPYTPNAVALLQSRVNATHWFARDLSERDALWAAEQCLRSPASAVVFVWAVAPGTAALRRLKLAAAGTHSVAILFRGLRDASQPSPATVRLALRPERERLRIDVIKYEGRKPSTVILDVRSRWQWAPVS